MPPISDFLDSKDPANPQPPASMKNSIIPPNTTTNQQRNIQTAYSQLDAKNIDWQKAPVIIDCDAMPNRMGWMQGI
jgi:hypothetical protein